MMMTTGDKAQFNVYLPRELIRRVKIASIDVDCSLSQFVEEALLARLARAEQGSDQRKEQR